MKKLSDEYHRVFDELMARQPRPVRSGKKTIPDGVALRRIRAEIELLQATGGTYREAVANIEGILALAGFRVKQTGTLTDEKSFGRVNPPPDEASERKRSK